MVHAQSTFYVRQGAAGSANGSDWTNAFPTLPSTLQRGATYYIADGTYSGYTFDDPTSGTTVIAIKKATLADHGTSTGWQNGYGDGQALFTGALRFHTNDYLFDGQTRNPDWRSGYGFKVRPSFTPRRTDSSVYLGVPFTSGARNITLRHLEVEGTGDRTDTYWDRGIYSTRDSSDITIAQSYVHEQGNVPFLILQTTRITIEHTLIARNQSTATAHGEGLAVRDGTHNFVFRYNVMEDIEGTAYIATPTSGHPGCAGTVQSNWYIYGNVFYRRGATAGSASGGTTGNGIFILFDHQHQGDLYFVNNSIIGVNNGFVGLATGTGAGCALNMTVRNNIWYNVGKSVGRPANVQALTWTHNAYLTTATTDPDPNKQVGNSNPFIDLPGYNFRLATPTLPGISLTHPYDTDVFGAVRGADGVWDRGALEFTLGALPAPTGLRVIP
jgi:hypothetical protein